MLRVLFVLSAWLMIASASKLKGYIPHKTTGASRLGHQPIEIMNGGDRSLAFPGSINQNSPLAYMLATPEEMEEVADHLSEEHNAGLSSFLELDHHDSFQAFGDDYMKAMNPYVKQAAKELINKEHGLGEMFEEQMLFDLNDYEGKKAWKAFHDMDTNDDGKITKAEKDAYMAV